MTREQIQDLVVEILRRCYPPDDFRLSRSFWSPKDPDVFYVPLDWATVEYGCACYLMEYRCSELSLMNVEQIVDHVQGELDKAVDGLREKSTEAITADGHGNIGIFGGGIYVRGEKLGD